MSRDKHRAPTEPRCGLIAVSYKHLVPPGPKHFFNNSLLKHYAISYPRNVFRSNHTSRREAIMGIRAGHVMLDSPRLASTFPPPLASLLFRGRVARLACR